VNAHSLSQGGDEIRFDLKIIEACGGGVFVTIRLDHAGKVDTSVDKMQVDSAQNKLQVMERAPAQSFKFHGFIKYSFVWKTHSNLSSPTPLSFSLLVPLLFQEVPF
jgi:hypothetical protein